MVRVIEGELLGRNSGAAAYDVARRWLVASAAAQREPEGTDLYIRRAHVAIGSYLDTAIMNGPRGAVQAGLDLYA